MDSRVSDHGANDSSIHSSSTVQSKKYKDVDAQLRHSQEVQESITQLRQRLLGERQQQRVAATQQESVYAVSSSSQQ
jgi:hypothetical protein